jgi:cytochrome c
LATPAFAEGDAEKGKSVFNKCKTCHLIADPEGNVLVKGTRTGPNLYGIVGRTSGTGDFRYSKALISAGENGLVWDEAQIAAFVTDPRGFLKDLGGDNKTRMTFKLRSGGEDVAAYLATFGAAPVAEDTEGTEEGEAVEATESSEAASE